MAHILSDSRTSSKGLTTLSPSPRAEVHQVGRAVIERPLPAEAVKKCRGARQYSNYHSLDPILGDPP
jgi:hypothetical protein